MADLLRSACLPLPFVHRNPPPFTAFYRGTDFIRLRSRMTYVEKAASLDTSNPGIERLGVASMQVRMCVLLVHDCICSVAARPACCRCCAQRCGLPSACGFFCCRAASAPTAWPAGAGKPRRALLDARRPSRAAPA